MTTTFATNSNNDLFLGSDGNIVIANNLEGIIAACETATKAQLAEMVLETGQGIPNFQTIWVGSPNYSVFTTYLRNTLSQVPGVQEVQSLELKTEENVLSYVAMIKTSFGTAVING